MPEISPDLHAVRSAAVGLSLLHTHLALGILNKNAKLTIDRISSPIQRCKYPAPVRVKYDKVL